MFGDPTEGFGETPSIDTVDCGEAGDVGEVSPARIGRAALHSCHDLLGQRIAGDDQLTAQKARQGDCFCSGADRIADVDVDVEQEPSAGQRPRDGDADPAVGIADPDHFGSDGLGVEGQAIVELDLHDLYDDAPNSLGAVVTVAGRQIDVSRRPTRVERGKQDAALEDETVGVGRPGEAVEEPSRAYSCWSSSDGRPAWRARFWRSR
jgi:hypothetical protein